MPEFLVTLRPIRDYNLSDLILIEANDFDQCIELAFFSRNVASSWCISNVECDDVDVPKITRDILFEEFAAWRYRSKNLTTRVSWIDYYKEKLS